MAQILARGPVEGRLCLVVPVGVSDSTLKKKMKRLHFRNENGTFTHTIHLHVITKYQNMTHPPNTPKL